MQQKPGRKEPGTQGTEAQSGGKCASSVRHSQWQRISTSHHLPTSPSLLSRGLESAKYYALLPKSLSISSATFFKLQRSKKEQSSLESQSSIVHVCILASVQSAKAVWAFFHQPSANLSQKKDQDCENDVTTVHAPPWPCQIKVPKSWVLQIVSVLTS